MKKLTALFMAVAMMLTATAVFAFDANNEVVVVSREEGSGTRGAFVEITGVLAKDADGNEVDYTTPEAEVQNATSQVLVSVAENELAIGYVSLAALNETVKALKIDGVEATVENIVSGEYKVARPFNVVTKKDGQLSEIAQNFFDFIMSAEGQKVISENDAIAVDANAPAFEVKEIEGKVVVGGSTSVGPIMEKLAEAYKALNPKADIQVQGGGSSTGVNQALEGTFDLGMASRAIKASEIEKGALGTAIAMDGIAVIVNPANTTEELSLEQLRQIFVGEILNWSDLNK
ncbi:MAG: substrate-binding domain-containing protein [Eubacteriales bacterium]|nr:substrate-binding domain-containing protein [Eubacteriales bacterium]